MKSFNTFLASVLLLAVFTLTCSRALAGGPKSKDKVWTRWELSPVADIYYRVEMISDNEAAASKSVTVEFLNNYKKDVSFCFAINDNGTPEVSYKPVMNLKKKRTAVMDYPRPVGATDMKINIVSVQLGK